MAGNLSSCWAIPITVVDGFGNIITEIEAVMVGTRHGDDHVGLLGSGMPVTKQILEPDIPGDGWLRNNSICRPNKVAKF